MNDRQLSVKQLRKKLADFGAKNKAHYEKNLVQKTYNGYSARQKIQEFEDLCASWSSPTSNEDTKSPCVTESSREASFPHSLEESSSGESERDSLTPPPRIPRFRSFTPATKDDFHGLRILSLEETPESKSEQPFPSRWGLQSEVAGGETARRTVASLLKTTNGSWSDGEIEESDDEEDLELNKVMETRSLGGGGPLRKSGFRQRLVRRLHHRKTKSTGGLRQHLPKLLCRSKKDEEFSPLKSVPVDVDYSTEHIEANIIPADQSEVSTVSTAPTYSSSIPAVEPKEDIKTSANSLSLTASKQPSHVRASSFVGTISVHPQVPSAFYKRPQGSAWSGSEEENYCEFDAILPGAVTGSLVDVFGHEASSVKSGMSRSSPKASTKGDYSSATEKLMTPPEDKKRENITSKTKPQRNLNVSAKVERFGGTKMPMSAVERRKAQLAQKWAEDRQPKVSSKAQWQVCRQTGTYKKKVVLHYS